MKKLRRSRGDAAGAKLATSPDERFAVNVGTTLSVPGWCPPSWRALVGRRVVRRRPGGGAEGR